MTAEAVGDDVLVERDLEARMGDGTALRADVYRPRAAGADLPVLLQRTPYDKALYTELGAYYARAGYVCVIQDVRGQFASGGVFTPFENEAADGVDTLTWAADLPGTTGRVGMVGTSYQATCAWQAAVTRPKALAAMACAVTPVDYYGDWFFPGGAFAWAFATTWLLRNVANSAAARLPDGEHLSRGMTTAYDAIGASWYRYLPLCEFPPLLPDRDDVAPYFFSWINDHPHRDDYWERLSLRGRIEQVEIPVLNVAGWYDTFIRAGVEAFQALQESGNPAGEASRLVIGPWGHNNWGRSLGDVDFGDEAVRAFPAMVVEWMDRWLKGHQGPRDPSPTSPVRYFSMGDRTWRDAATWPPPGFTETRLFLAAHGRLVDLAGEPSTESFVYDPADPVPSVGGHSCCYEPASPIGPYDQREVERRSDILVYSSEVLTRPVEIAGPVQVELFAASTALDTDFTAKLVDVHPHGPAINLGEGIVRARHRHGTDRADLLTPGEVNRFEIHLQPTANVFGVGHRIRVEVSSSNFPTFDRNPNTGAAFGQGTDLITARQTIHHGLDHPSCLRLLTSGPVAEVGQDAGQGQG